MPRDVRVDLPLQTLTHLDADGTAVFPHTVLIAAEGSDVTFIDRFTSRDLRRALSDAIVEIYVGDGARAPIRVDPEWGAGVTHLAVQRATVGRDAELRSLAIGFGGSLARAEAETVLDGQGGFSEMLGIFFADGSQHFDHRSVQDHVAPNCTSTLLVQGRAAILYRGLCGWVHVRPAPEGRSQYRRVRSTSCSKKAKAAIPNLEIEANDVKCGQGTAPARSHPTSLCSTCESRGIPAKEAERLVVLGFFQEVLDRVQIDEVREGAEAAIASELAGGARG